MSSVIRHNCLRIQIMRVSRVSVRVSNSFLPVPSCSFLPVPLPFPRSFLLVRVSREGVRVSCNISQGGGRSELRASEVQATG